LKHQFKQCVKKATDRLQQQMLNHQFEAMHPKKNQLTVKHTPFVVTKVEASV
jgi:hypothetical protein